MMILRLCRCCRVEYDFDNCTCRVLCACGSGKCEAHCVAHVNARAGVFAEIAAAIKVGVLGRPTSQEGASDAVSQGAQGAFGYE